MTVSMKQLFPHGAIGDYFDSGKSAYFVRWQVDFALSVWYNRGS